MGLSLGHMVIILVIVLIIWGPSRLGNVGKGIGEAVRGFKKGLHGDDSIDVTDTSLNQSRRAEQIDVTTTDVTHSTTSTSTSKDKTRT